MKKYSLGIRAWVVFSLGSGFFFLMYVARIAPSVMSLELMRDFHVNAVAMSSLSLFYFYPYISMQMPVGMLMDRFGPRFLLTLMTLLCAVSIFMFSVSHTLFLASMSRFLLGFGAAFAFVGALKLGSEWFPPYRIGLLAGLTQALGMFGGYLGQQPLAMGIEHMGWRYSLMVVASLFLLLSFLMVTIVRNRPLEAPWLQELGIATTPTLTGKALLQGLSAVLKNSQTWFIGIYAGLLYAPTAAFAELWGNSFLRQVYHFDITKAATGVGIVFLGWGIGGPILGAWSDRLGRRKPLMLLSAFSGVVLMSVILYIPELPTGLLFTLLFIFGFLNTGVGIAYAAASEVNARQFSGTTLGIANMLSIAVGVLSQPLVAWMLHKNWSGEMQDGVPLYSAENYYSAMMLLPLCSIAAFVLAWFIRETYCQPTPTYLR
jgi:MFS family permease